MLSTNCMKFPVSGFLPPKLYSNFYFVYFGIAVSKRRVDCKQLFSFVPVFSICISAENDSWNNKIKLTSKFIIGYDFSPQK